MHTRRLARRSCGRSCGMSLPGAQATRADRGAYVCTAMDTADEGLPGRRRGGAWAGAAAGLPRATMRLRDCFQDSFSAGPVETAGEQVVLLNCTLYRGRGGELYVACVSHAHTRPRRLRPGPSWSLGAVGQPRGVQQGAVPEAVPLGDGAGRRPRSGPRRRRGRGAAGSPGGGHVGPAEPGGWPSGSCAKGGLVGSQLGGTKNACQAPSRPGSFQIKSGSLQGGA